MLKCGKEEPLQANANLLMLNEETGVKVPSYHEEDRLNRYTFVRVGEKAEAEYAFIMMLQTICQELFNTLSWFLIKRHYTAGDYRISSLTWLSQRKKEGWVTYHNDTLATACKFADFTKPITHLPGYRNHDGNLLAFLGDRPLPSILTQPPLQASIELNFGSDLAPSEQFITWLADNKLTLAYPCNLEFKRWGFIIITPEYINTVKMKQQGIIETIQSGLDKSLWSL